MALPRATFPTMQKTQEVAEPTEYVRSAEAMELLHISRRTLERWVAAGVLPASKVGGVGTRRYLRADIEALLRGERPESAA